MVKQMILSRSISRPLMTSRSLSLLPSLSPPTLSHNERCSAGSARREVSTRRRLRDSDSQQAERRRRRLNTRRRRHTNPPTDQPAKQPNHQPEAQTCHGHAGPTRPSPFCCLHKSSTTTWGRQTKNWLLASPRCFLLFDTKYQDQTGHTLSHQHVPFLLCVFYAYPQWCTEIPTILGNFSSF